MPLMHGFSLFDIEAREETGEERRIGGEDRVREGSVVEVGGYRRRLEPGH